MSNRVDRAVQAIQNEIESIVDDLSDDDFLEVMDEIANYCESSAEAKRDELERKK